MFGSLQKEKKKNNTMIHYIQIQSSSILYFTNNFTYILILKVLQSHEISLNHSDVSNF